MTSHVITIQHPAHVHFFKHAIGELRDAGHEVHVFARRKEVAIDLLRAYGIDHEVLAGAASSLGSLARVQLIYEWRLLKRARAIRPDVMAAIGEPGVAHVAKLLGAKSVVFTDTEHARLQNALTFPFADRVCTPACYRDDLGAKHVRYPGYHELAYLRPERFSPDPTIGEELGVTDDETLALVRAVSWGAAHDVGDSGFADVGDVIERLEAAGARVLVSAEGKVPRGVERVRVPPQRMHDLLARADLFVGESATMASECAVLGTPAVFVSSSTRGYTTDLEREYGLVANFHGPDRHEAGIERAVSLVGSDENWAARRQRLLDATADTTEVIVRELTAAGR